MHGHRTLRTAAMWRSQQSRHESITWREDVVGWPDTFQDPPTTEGC